MIEVLNTVKSVKFFKVKGPREARPLGFDTENPPGGAEFDDFENLPWGCPGGW